MSVGSNFHLQRIQGAGARMHQALQSDAVRNVEIKTREWLRVLSESHVWLWNH